MLNILPDLFNEVVVFTKATNSSSAALGTVLNSEHIAETSASIWMHQKIKQFSFYIEPPVDFFCGAFYESAF